MGITVSPKKIFKQINIGSEKKGFNFFDRHAVNKQVYAFPPYLCKFFLECLLKY